MDSDKYFVFKDYNYLPYEQQNRLNNIVNELWRNYADWRKTNWVEFSKNILIEMGLEWKTYVGYTIVDEKKWAIAKIKYGLL